MSFETELKETALNDIEKHKKSGGKVVLNKITSLIDELREHPFDGTGKPETSAF